MKAAGAILRKERREFVRDGRALVALGIVALLSIAAFWLSSQRVESSEAARTAAAQRDRRTWEGQGERNVHGMAHFSSWAFKPQTALSVFEPGLTPFYGEAIWMEAHYQNPANHRPAEDATEARRFADLSPAWLTATLLPLLLIGLGFASLAREREGGQWRQMAASGVSAGSVLAGKALMLVGLGVAMALLFTLPALLAGSALPAPGDEAVRWLAILVAAALFATALVGITLAVSAACRTTRAALLGLVGFWMVSVILAPRLVASSAQAVAPSPSLHSFTAHLDTDLSKGIPPDQAPEALVRRLEDDTLERYGVRYLEDLPVNFEGIMLQASEDHGNAVFDRHFGMLRAAHERQQRIFRAGGLISPVIAFRNATAAFAGTDGAHHWHFANAAEQHRRLTVRMLNEDIMRNAGADTYGLSYRADPSLWTRIPEFSYRAPAWTVSAAAAVDLAVLGAWVVGGFLAARLAVARWRSA